MAITSYQGMSIKQQLHGYHDATACHPLGCRMDISAYYTKQSGKQLSCLCTDTHKHQKVYEALMAIV
ncbi:MAG: hypothetical protein KA972_02440 [Brachymonas sp.]|jgi:hypothetical protein|nr:hypothetical protein [Brachymonas sp.]